MGSNMAENHPVGFQWVVEGQHNGARVYHVDPRFTRTSALADAYVPLRAGTDVAFLGGIIHEILEREADFREYVLPYTNASHIINSGVELPEDLSGVFSGFDEEAAEYDDKTWQYEGEGVETVAAAGKRGRDLDRDEGTHGHKPGAESAPDHEEEGGEAFEGGSISNVGQIETDETLQHPRCVYQLLKRHYARYTPDFVADTCGVSKELFGKLVDDLIANSGPERTSMLVYSVGWTQHTTGVQNIRAASIIQLLLGNMGRPGGGILALRGHASIQGSTDIPTLYDLLPGYLPMPTADGHPDLDTYERRTTAQQGFWGETRSYLVSLLKAWWGQAATADNDFCFDYLPRISGDHSTYTTTFDMLDGKVDGFFLWGQNPAVGSSHGRLHRLAMAQLKWLVVRDLVEIESATFWRDAPEVEAGEIVPEHCQTEVFFLPSAAHVEKDGTFTNTQRLLQWHDKAREAPGDCISDLSFAYHLGLRIREKLSADPAAAADPKNRPILDLTWDYPTQGPKDEVEADAVLREINGWNADGEPLGMYTELEADGSTACGCWIYSGCYAEGVNQTRRRTPGYEQDSYAREWAWAWPDNRRILYNRASAKPDGTPWSERKKLVWWDDEAGEWTGFDKPDFVPDLHPDHTPEDGATGVAAISGNDPFIMQADGKGWLWAPSGLGDGPLPVHYEPHESPVRNTLWEHGEGTDDRRGQSSPTRLRPAHPLNPDNPGSDGSSPTDNPYPHVLTTYRIAEHHTAGGMSRHQQRLSELAPEMFCEVDRQLARMARLEHGGWATVVTSRSAIEARVMVTDRLRPWRINGRVVHQVGLPYHFGPGGIATGDGANDLLPIAMDPNVHIGEFKVATCAILPGRRPRGAALRAFVEGRVRTTDAGYAGGPPDFTPEDLEHEAEDDGKR
jgi:formate dehydrogenase major subunit